MSQVMAGCQRVYRILAVIIGTFFFTGYSGEASEITGTVYVTMRSGDVKRAADTEVLLVAGHPDFEAKWKALAQEFRQASVHAEYRQAQAEHKQAREKLSAAQTQTEEERGKTDASSRQFQICLDAWRAGLKNLDKRWEPLRNLAELEECKVAERLREEASAVADAQSKRTWNAYEKVSVAFERERKVEERVENVKKDYRKKAVELLIWGQVKKTRTNIDGRYDFRGIQPGRYYLFTVYQIFSNETIWMVPGEFRATRHTLDLSNSNSGWPF